MWVRTLNLLIGGIMKTLKVGNKVLKDLEVRLHRDIIPIPPQEGNNFKLQSFVSGYVQKGWVAGRPVFEPFEAILKYELTSARSPKGYVIYSWSYQGTAGVQVPDYLRNLTHRSTELERLFGASDFLGDYVFKEVETAIKVYLNTYFQGYEKLNKALMAKLADAQDLKSCVHYGRPSSTLGGCMWLEVTPYKTLSIFDLAVSTWWTEELAQA